MSNDIDATEALNFLQDNEWNPENNQPLADSARMGVMFTEPRTRDEIPYTWERHKRAIIESFAPITPLEVGLAETAAKLMWRIEVLDAYERECIALNQRHIDQIAFELANNPDLARSSEERFLAQQMKPIVDRQKTEQHWRSDQQKADDRELYASCVDSLASSEESRTRLLAKPIAPRKAT